MNWDADTLKGKNKEQLVWLTSSNEMILMHRHDSALSQVSGMFKITTVVKYFTNQDHLYLLHPAGIICFMSHSLLNRRNFNCELCVNYE